jgi:ABC-type multidrug transport system fused ATPase/permease subunit
MPSLAELPEALRTLRKEGDRTIAWQLAGTTLAVVAGGLLAGVAPLALKGMVDAVSSGETLLHSSAKASAMTFCIAYLLALCGGRLLIELRPPLIGAAEQRLYGGLRRRFFARLLELDLAFHLGRRTGALVQTLAQAIAGYQIIIFHLVSSVVPVLVELATVSVVLITLDQPALTASFAAAALAYLAVLTLCTSGVEGDARLVSEASHDVQSVLTDSLLNYETIKCFGAEESTRDRFTGATCTLRDRWVHLHRGRARIGFALTSTVALSVTLSLGVALHAVMRGSLSVGGFVLANVYMLQVLRPLEMLGSAARELSQALAFIHPLLELLRDSPTPKDVSGPVRTRLTRNASQDERSASCEWATKIGTGSQAPNIRFRNLHFAYEVGKPVLQGLDLEIAPGCALAIVGASGCGKSSVVRLLLRLYEPQVGCIELDDVAINALPATFVRSMIGLVPQDTVLFNDTIAFNIGTGKANSPRADIERAARLAHLHDFVESLPAGYNTVVGERGLRLSGGERQRISIARAVLRNPRIYVFDEATSMLDSLTERAILRNLRDVSSGCTTITIAHRLSSVRHADEILVLERGRIVEHGDHATLLARDGAYADLWAAQTVCAQ